MLSSGSGSSGFTPYERWLQVLIKLLGGWYVPSYRYGEYKIWGLTAIMIVELINLLYDAKISLHQPPKSFINT